MRNRTHYEEDDEQFDAPAYTVKGYRGIAWHVMGWETEPDEDTEWSGCENRTGRVVAIMVGDDRRFTFDLSDITPLGENGYCPSCGQTGCMHGRAF